MTNRGMQPLSRSRNLVFIPPCELRGGSTRESVHHISIVAFLSLFLHSDTTTHLTRCTLCVRPTLFFASPPSRVSTARPLLDPPPSEIEEANVRTRVISLLLLFLPLLLLFPPPPPPSEFFPGSPQRPSAGEVATEAPFFAAIRELLHVPNTRGVNR